MIMINGVNEKLDDFIDDHKWEPFEDYDPSFIWEAD